MHKKYKHLFFDLDRTIWDFEKNSHETLSELYTEFNLSSLGVKSFQEFSSLYLKHNEQLWDDYAKGIVDKETLRTQRFHKTFLDFGITDAKLTLKFADCYVLNSPLKTHLHPFAIETLTYLSEKYTLHIITNGFEEVQHIKMKTSGIKDYFLNVITSELAGSKKPGKKIFHYSLYRAKAKSRESIMIGDSLEIDVLGAKNAGIDQVYFNPDKLKHSSDITYEINCLSELMKIL